MSASTAGVGGHRYSGHAGNGGRHAVCRQRARRQRQALRADLSARLGRDVRLDNDANCFALSEAWDDEFTQYPLVMGLILGTGVGGGLVLNGKSITGHSYITGEFGHIRLPVDALEVVGRDFPLTLRLRPAGLH
jgi:predicted NBD/HSP70 family sugar kinase